MIDCRVISTLRDGFCSSDSVFLGVEIFCKVLSDPAVQRCGFGELGR
jgi:hypothetical protein